MSKINFKISDDSITNKVQGRKAIFLDTNIWVHVANEKTQIAKDIRYYLIKLVNNGIVFCPLSAPLIWELYKQNFESALRVGSLMEELSLNICYLSIDEVIHKEIKKYVLSIINKSKLLVSGKDIYGPVMAYLFSNYSLDFPSDYSQSQIIHFSKVFTPIMNNLSLTDILKMRSDSLPIKYESSKIAYKKQNNKRREFTKGDKTKMRRIEEEFAAQNIILPIIYKINSQLPITQVFLLVNHFNSLPKDKYGGSLKSILEYLPATKCNIEIMTVTGYDITRNDNMNDYFDRELMILPLAYADVFVSEDKWIKHILINLSDITKNNNILYISTLNDLKKYLEKMLA